jgi:hypothetical protein
VNANDPVPRSAEVATSVMPSACARRVRSRFAKLCAAAVGPPARWNGKVAALASKAAPEGAVETDYGLTSVGKICRVYGYQRVNFPVTRYI